MSSFLIRLARASRRRICHHRRMADPPPVDDLARLRAGIDELDLRLVVLLAERARLVEGIAEHKRRHRVPVVDRHREDAMLERTARLAKKEGLDPRIAQQVLRTVIDAFTLLQVEDLAVGGDDPPAATERGGGDGVCQGG